MGEQVTVTAATAEHDELSGTLSLATGPGLIVVPERWGVDAHAADVVERFAAAGFSAFAPNLVAPARTGATLSAVAAATLELNLADAVTALAAAVDLLVERTGTARVGVVGYGAGAALALALAAARPDRIKAVAPYYGLVPADAVAPDWSALDAKVVGEYAELDPDASPDRVAAFEAQLRDLGKDATMNVHLGAKAGFFNDARPDVYAVEPALESWERTLALLREELVDRD